MIVRWVLFVGTPVLAVLLGSILAITIALISIGTGSSRLASLTTRQGMLSQKVAKEALRYARHPAPKILSELRHSMQIFAVTQRALQLGGATPSDLEGHTFEHMAGTTDPALRRLFRKASSEWNTISDAIERLIVAARQRQDALSTLELKNPRLIRKVDEVTQLLTSRAETSALLFAGQQGMIAERTAKQALFYDLTPEPARRDELLASIEAFRLKNKQLRSREGRVWRNRVPRPTSQIAEKLDEINWLWLDQADALVTLSDEQSDFHRAVELINELNPKLLQTLSLAATRAEHITQNNIGVLQTLQFSLVFLGLGLAAIISVFIFRVVRSLIQLSKAANEISCGQVQAPIPHLNLGIDELQDLSRSFERMRLSLSKAMQLLEQRRSTNQQSTDTSPTPSSGDYSLD